MKHLFKTRFLAQLTAVVIIAFSVLAGCKSYDKDINGLQTSITELKSQISDLKGTIPTGVDAKIADLTTQINTLKTTLTTATGDITSIKSDLVSKATEIQALKDFKTSATAKIAALETAVANAATKAELTALQNQVGTMATTLTTLTGRVDLLSTNLTKLQNDFTTAQGQIEARLHLLEALLNVSNGKSTSLTGVNGIADELAKITANTAAINALKTELTALKATVATVDDLKKVNDNMKKLVAAMSLNFDALSSRLTSLTFVADTYVNGIEALNLSPLVSQCTTITPAITAVYHLNPSFITAADIDVNNMSFAVIKATNTITGMNTAGAAAQQVKANFVKIEDGKLYVSVSVVDYNTLLGSSGGNIMSGNTETFHSIALQVPLSDKAVKENSITYNAGENTVVVGDKEFPASRVITAQYVRLFSKEMSASELSLVKESNMSVLTTTLAATKALAVEGVDGATASAPQIVILNYGATMNLDTVVATAMGTTLFDMEKYGLKFKFDTKDGNSTFEYKRGVNNTDQQKFIDLSDGNKGTIKARVFGDSEIAASQGRTPIVRVWVYNDQAPTCPILLGFVKILLADKPLPTPITTITFNENLTAPCSDYARTLTVEQMNVNVYNYVKMSKEEFHTIHPTLVTGGDGLLEQITDPQQTDTYLLKWTIPASTVWSALMASTTGSVTFNATATYVSGIPTMYPNVVIPFKVTFTKPGALNLTSAQLITNYWYSNTAVSPYPYVKHNVYVPNLGETNSALCIFSNNINQAFEQNANKSLAGVPSIYEYYFLPVQPNHADGTTNGTTLTVSSDGKQLMSGSEVVATINPFVANTGDVLTLNKASVTAKRLLNYGSEFLKARIGIRTVYCTNESLQQYKRAITINGNPYFDVVFVRPINVTPNTTEKFIDGKNFGEANTYLEIAKLVNLADWRNDANYVSTFAKYAWYYQYYGVTAITINASLIKTDLNQAAGVKVPLSNYPDLEVKYMASVPGVTPVATYGYLTYRNTGNTLDKPFNLYVPVTITYTWGDIVSEVITVPVDKTVGPSGVKRK